MPNNLEYIINIFKMLGCLDFLRIILENILANFNQKDIPSITGYDVLLEALLVAGLEKIGITLSNMRE